MVEFIEDILDIDPKKVEQNLKMYNSLFNENKTLKDCNIIIKDVNVYLCGEYVSNDYIFDKSNYLKQIDTFTQSKKEITSKLFDYKHEIINFRMENTRYR